MTETETHEGFANYETWSCVLWLNNNQQLQEAIHIVVRHEVREHKSLTFYEIGELIIDSLDGGALAREAGSVWRIDRVELGESLSVDAIEGHEDYAIITRTPDHGRGVVTYVGEQA
jgi:hypothetical protein